MLLLFRFSIIFLVPLTSWVQGRVHAPYQVSIYLYDSYNPSFPNTNNFPVCSGVIIHPLFCVTTADCVHSHVLANNITYTQPLLNDSIYIVGGNFSKVTDNIKYVSDIYIHPEFNPSTMLNDIAVIKLTSPFQLDGNGDRQWIALPDYYTRYDRCAFSINLPGQTTWYPFTEPKQTSVVNNLICRRNNSYVNTEIENLSLCSKYQFDHPFMCTVPENQLRLSRDRGTPLICDNRLAGSLSVILPSNNQYVMNASDSCANTLLTNAYYTKMSVYVNWIHNIMSRYAPQQTLNGQPISLVPTAPPYEAGIMTPVRPPSKGIATSIRSNSVVEISIAFVTCLFAYFCVLN